MPDQPSRSEAMTRRKPSITRVVTLDRGRTATVTGLQPTDTIESVFDKREGRMKLLVKSANGVVIRQVRIEVADA